ncbi:alpha/beta-hydrolase [Gigaspora margarita]|uniref:Alpha/beta-hydrolase n=1 Tax=Gigaspora margarita TaxID=4874 RepID=A0A8H3WXQ0_GIGMA|nr:alpha/beta-hydrolase [Gigaspora margarita]
MIDHLLGRPSPSWKRVQVFLVSLTWFFVLFKIDRRGPRFLHTWNEKLSRFSPFQLVAGTLAALYILKNADRMIGLGAPEPLARLYSRNYYRATWVLTALDAGFWTAMPIRPKLFRDIMSILFSIYYLIFADQADEKTRRIRATVTVEQLRTSWEKTLNPYLRALIRFTHPRLTIHQKKVLIPRPENSLYSKQVTGYIYYEGPLESFKYCDSLILNFPGGGFIGMPPPCHEDYLAHWAKKTKVPILSIDYGKAPEYPYPFALDECFDVYRSIIESNGEVIGMAGWKDKDGSRRKQMKVVLIGDSAGGNLVASVMYKILEYQMPIPHPSGLILIYPVLNFDITCWMPPDQLSVIRAESSTSIPGVLESKDHLSHKSPLSVVPDVKKRRWRKSFSGPREDERTLEDRVRVIEGHTVTDKNEKDRLRPVIGTRLTMTSRMSYFNDRILNADLMRALAIIYIGPNNYPVFSSDYLLSPIVGPIELLAKFPKTYLMCGEKDPLVDDTVVFAGRIREAKKIKKRQQLEDKGRYGENFRMSSMNNNDNSNTDSEDWVEVKIIQGSSHAFLQMPTLLPENKGAVRACALWLHECCQDKTDDINTNCTEIIHEDEGLTFTTRRSKNNGITNSKENENRNLDPEQIQDSTSIMNNLYVSEPSAMIPSNDNIQKSVSTTVLAPGHEIWEQKNIVNENELLKRRRDTLVRNLTEGCNTTTAVEQSISEKMTKDI